MTKITKFTVGPLETNCYLVYDSVSKEGVLIDPGFFVQDIMDTIKKNALIVKYIINTHGHADHISGNAKFGYPVLIHEYDNEFLNNPIKNLSFLAGGLSGGPTVKKLLKDRDLVTVGDIKFEVIHTPGHTPGSISLKVGNKIFTGDTLFNEGVGRTDVPGGSAEDLLNSIKNRLMVYPDSTEILPGHGPNSTIGHERMHNPFLDM